MYIFSAAEATRGIRIEISDATSLGLSLSDSLKFFIEDNNLDRELQSIQIIDYIADVPLIASNATYKLLGSNYADSMSGNGGNDYVFGDDGNDTLRGWGGDDTLIGGKGCDYLVGMRGNDVLQGDIGNDTLVGGKGSDTFILNQVDTLDLISDFNVSEKDICLLDSQIFMGIKSGKLTTIDISSSPTENSIVVANTFQISNLVDFQGIALVYNTDTKQLLYCNHDTLNPILSTNLPEMPLNNNTIFAAF